MEPHREPGIQKPSHSRLLQLLRVFARLGQVRSQSSGCELWGVVTQPQGAIQLNPRRQRLVHVKPFAFTQLHAAKQEKCKKTEVRASATCHCNALIWLEPSITASQISFLTCQGLPS